jgi:hypothetical protein
MSSAPNHEASPLEAAVAAYIAQRGIREVLHFTTNNGALGIFASGAVLSRDRLGQEQYIEHIYVPNCQTRLKDAAWTDYVNLSISRVNSRMLGYSRKWHAIEDIWWMILSFDASLLGHPDVQFVTTNNTYTNCLQRGTGVEGLNALFAPSVEWGWQGSRTNRYPGVPDEWTTDPQAEVLYPQQVPIHYLRRIYVHEPENADTVRSWLPIFQHVPRVPVLHRPEVFR